MGGVVRELEGEAAVGAAVWAVVERRVDEGSEGATGAGKGEAEVAGRENVGSESADFPPGVVGDAAFVNEAGEHFESEDDVVADGGDEAGEADDAAGTV